MSANAKSLTNWNKIIIVALILGILHITTRNEWKFSKNANKNYKRNSTVNENKDITKKKKQLHDWLASVWSMQVLFKLSLPPLWYESYHNFGYIRPQWYFLFGVIRVFIECDAWMYVAAITFNHLKKKTTIKLCAMQHAAWNINAHHWKCFHSLYLIAESKIYSYALTFIWNGIGYDWRTRTIFIFFTDRSLFVCLFPWFLLTGLFTILPVQFRAISNFRVINI